MTGKSSPAVGSEENGQDNTTNLAPVVVSEPGERSGACVGKDDINKVIASWVWSINIFIKPLNMISKMNIRPVLAIMAIFIIKSTSF